MKKSLYKLIFCSLFRWKIVGKMEGSIQKSVLMVLPHTSMFDFFVGMFARGIIGLEMHYVAKKEFFRFPFGSWFRWMGGAPLDRTGNRNKVDEIVSIFHKRKIFRMAIAPEGTRSKVETLKTGFYYIALKANVPIIPIAFDYGKKEVNLGQPFYPTGNLESDLKQLMTHFVGATGKHVDKTFDVHQFLETSGR